MRIILIGFMGSGKTTVSTLLADQLHLPVTDLDRAIEQSSGKSIPQIFQESGEEGFRTIEHQTLTTVLQGRDGILATGGGTPLRADNRQALAADPAPVILLHASPEETARRIQHNGERPLADALDTAGLAALLAKRQARYDECADFTIDTDNRTPQEIVDQIIGLIKN